MDTTSLHTHTHTHTHTYCKYSISWSNFIKILYLTSYLVRTLFFLLLSYLLHAAEFFLRSYSRNSPHFIETESSLPPSQVPPTVPILSQIDPGCLWIYWICSRGQPTKGWSSSLGFGRGAKNSSPYKRIVLQSFKKTSVLDCAFIIGSNVFFIVKWMSTTVAYYAFRWTSRVKTNVFQEDIIQSRILKPLTCLFLRYDEWMTFSFTSMKHYREKLSRMFMWFVKPLSGRPTLNY